MGEAAKRSDDSADGAYRHIQVRVNADGFGAEVTDLALNRPLSPEALTEVKQAWAAHSVVWFPSQPLTHDELEAVTLQFGSFGEDPFIKPLREHPHILELRREPAEKARNFGAGWHSDWSFQERPPAATLLHSKVVPPMGGDTIYADCYRSYDALSDEMKRVLGGLEAVHSARRPYGTTGIYAKETDKRAMQIITGAAAEKTQVHPLVRTHPVTGRRSLFINPIYTIGIARMSEAESQALLGFLFGHMLQERFLYRHRWKPNMLIVWDNRCTMHYADGGYDGHLRLMHRTTVAGERPV